MVVSDSAAGAGASDEILAGVACSVVAALAVGNVSGGGLLMPSSAVDDVVPGCQCLVRDPHAGRMSPGTKAGCPCSLASLLLGLSTTRFGLAVTGRTAPWIATKDCPEFC